ncbi:acyl-CoA dehydrogenase family protein [Micromonospora sp. NPDC048170]|uniref:acyl-CoA dehydrogenase family protein n=1 Tax=Micromonospora sp. NPDC048170 TaxID=3154819 RepID=UPI0033FCA1EA
MPDQLFTLSDQLGDVLREAARECHVHGNVSSDAHKALRECGLFAMNVPRQYGGWGYDVPAVNAVVEELATVNPSVAIMLYLHCAVVSRIDAYGTAEQKRRWFGRVVGDNWLAASAWSEVGASADKRSLGTVARRQGDGSWRVTGGKTFSTSSTVADFFIVLAQLPDETPACDDAGYGRTNQALYLVPADAPGVRQSPEALAMIGMRGSGTGMVQFDDAEVAGTDLLCTGRDTPTAIGLPHRLGLTLGAVSVGTAQAAHRLVHHHFRSRGLLQDHDARGHLARLAVSVHAARAAVRDLAARAPHLTPEQAYAVKVFTTTAAQEVCAGARALLGSAGYLQHHEINRVSQDADAVMHMGPPNHLCIDLIGGAEAAS